MKKTTNKTERIPLRVTPEQKKSIEIQARSQKKRTTEYLIGLAEQDLKSISHEQLTINSLSENQFINNLLTHPDISNKDKQIIGKEIRKYV